MNKNTRRAGHLVPQGRAHWSVAPAHQARIATRLDRAPQPVRIGHGFVHGERRRTGERVLGAGARPRGTKIILLLFWFYPSTRETNLLLLLEN